MKNRILASAPFALLLAGVAAYAWVHCPFPYPRRLALPVGTLFTIALMALAAWKCRHAGMTFAWSLMLCWHAVFRVQSHYRLSPEIFVTLVDFLFLPAAVIFLFWLNGKFQKQELPLISNP